MAGGAGYAALGGEGAAKIGMAILDDDDEAAPLAAKRAAAGDDELSSEFAGFGCFCSCVPSGYLGVVQQFGNFAGYMEPGMNPYCPGVHRVQMINMAVQQLKCSTECKTRDHAIVVVKTAVQYRVEKQRVKNAVFDVQDPQPLIRALVDNAVRSSITALSLEKAYSNKGELSNDVLLSARNGMLQHGYSIRDVIVTDLSPDAAITKAMNARIKAKRDLQAATEKAEAQKVLKVKEAEAAAEAKHLSGQGVARMRVAMADGLRNSLENMRYGGLDPRESLCMMLTTQYLDTLKDFTSGPNTSAILVPFGHRQPPADDLGAPWPRSEALAEALEATPSSSGPAPALERRAQAPASRKSGRSGASGLEASPGVGSQTPAAVVKPKKKVKKKKITGNAGNRGSVASHVSGDEAEPAPEQEEMK